VKQSLKSISAAAAAAVFAITSAFAQPSTDVAARQVGDFKQGSIKGMPGVLPMNVLSLAALGDAPDSELHTLTLNLLDTFKNAATNGGGFSGGMGKFTATTVAPLFPTPEQFVAISKMNDDSKRPLWAQSDSSDAVFKDGRFHLPPSPQRLARADLARKIYRAVQTDVRNAKEYAFIFTVNAQREQLANNQQGAGGELVIRWTDMGNNEPVLGADAQVGRCTNIMTELSSDGHASFYGPKDPKQVCVAFNNVRGTSIPAAIKVRDTSQFKPNDELRVAIVFTLATPLVTSSKVEGDATAIVDAKASYMQIIEVNSMQTLGPRIPLGAKTADVRYYGGRECMLNLKSSRSLPFEIGATKCGLSAEEAQAAFR
jgi:hypothetical protein